MGIHNSVLGVIEDFSPNDSRPTEYDEIQIHVTDMRHHFLGIVDWNRHMFDLKFDNLFDNGRCDWVAFDSLEELFSFLVANRRIFFDDDGRDKAL